MKIRFPLITFILICSVFILYSSPVKFNSVNSLYGISIRVTNSICKDDNGFIWVSSKTGILRLTDNDYRIYQLPYETAGAISVKLIYEHSRLIAYTNNGQIFSYNPIYDRFDLLINLSKSININNLDVFKILIDRDGSYWIALDIGLYKYQSGNLSLMYDISLVRYSIEWFDEQHLIITKPTGILKLDIQSLESTCIYENDNIDRFFVSSLFLDKNHNKLWIGTFSNGLFCYNFGSESFTHILSLSIPKQPILDIEENSDSTILLGIDGQGLWELDKFGNRVLNVYKENADDPNSLHGNGVYDIFYDRDKRVWVCTISGGVSFYEIASPIVNQLVHHPNDANSLVNNDVNSIIEDRDGKIWFATNNGISCWDVGTGQWENFYNNKLKHAQVFLTLCEDDRGRIWAGSYSSGVYVLDSKTGQELAHYSRDDYEFSAVSNFIFDIFKDSQGDLWIGGVNGKFVCYHSKEGKFEIFADEPISSMSELSPNQILLGCSYGIKLLDKPSGDIQDFLPGYVVQDFLVLGDIIWVCTSGEGLLEYNFKSKEIKKYTTQAGLPSNFLNSIIHVNHCLWLGTESGLCRFNLRNKTAFTFPSIFTLSGFSYNKSALVRLKNKQLAWGSNNGAILFDPQSIKEIESKGKIYFQDIAISGRSIREIPSLKLNAPVDSLRTINLKYEQNSFNLELISIGMESGAKFSWKLEGFDKEWSLPANNRIITYTNIPIGNFELKLKLYDNSLINIISERTLSVRVIPPFWKKAWFIMLILIIISGIIFLALLNYINSLKQKHAEEKVRFFTNTAHDIRTSLTLVKAPVEELIHEKNLSDSGKNILKTAIEQSRKLTSVVTQLMDFQKVDIGKETISLSMIDIVNLVFNRKMIYESFARSKSIEIEFTSNKKIFFTAIDETKMEKVIDNLLSNAVKYSTSGGRILIELLCENGKWTLKVKDQGIGISKKAQRKLFKEFYRGENAVNSKIVGSGIGLLLVKDYVNMHGGSITCESQENIGSTFIVSIPFKEIVGTATPKNYMTEPNPYADSSNFIEPFEPVFGHNPTKMLNVLIVEDNDELRNFITDSIAGEFKIYVAEDGVKGWNLILRQLPDLVVTDVMMPNMDGFELCRLIKSTYETSHIPVILLSALSDKTEQLHGLGLGADDYLTKPFDINLLIQKIKSITHNREVVREKSLKILNENTDEPILANELNDKFVKKMLEVAFANISNAEFDKEDFASAMNVSTSLLYKKIKTFTGQSPTDFIKSVRLKHASELLQTRQHTVTEVSEMCGFSSVGYFSTVFKKAFGKSPTDLLP